MKGNAQEKKMIDEIVRLVGGTENINTAMHCSTRIRFTLKEEKKADVNALENVEGVLGAQWKAGQLQVIIGQKVGRIYEMMIEQYPMTSGGEVPDDFGEKNEEKKKFSFSAILDFLAGCLAPCLPCILGGGLLKGFISLFVMMKVLTSGSDMHTFLSIISDVPFYFLPFLLANSSAKKFNTDAFMAMAVAGLLMYPTVINNAGTAIHLLGFPVTYAKYSGSVIPIILSVWVLKYVYKGVNKVIPDFLRMLFAPICVFIIMGFVALGITGPIGYYLSSYVAMAVNWLFDFSPIVAGFIVGFTRQFIVFTGMHLSLTAIILSNLEVYGRDPLIAIYGISALAVAGAAFGAFLRLKNKNNKEIALSAGISAVLGITEPGLYGVLVRFKWPFMAASIASGVGGALSAILGGYGYVVSTPSVISLAIFGDTMPVVALCYAVAFVIALVLTYIKPFDENVEKSERAIQAEKKAVLKIKSEPTAVVAPVDGELIALSQVDDKTFASGVVGEGMAVIPANGKLTAPVSGTVAMVFPTQHAIGFTTDNGEEILMHIGLDTVGMKSEGFAIHVKEGQRVAAGEAIGSFDPELVKTRGLDPVVIVIATKKDGALACKPQGQVQAGSSIYTIG